MGAEAVTEQQERKPAADWDVAFEAVYRVIRRYPMEGDEGAKRNAIVWRGVMAALEASNPVQPCSYDYGGQPEFDVAPLEVTVQGEHHWVCPRCSAQLSHNPTHDESIDGLALVAVPDVYTCERCAYRYAD